MKYYYDNKELNLNDEMKKFVDQTFATYMSLYDKPKSNKFLLFADIDASDYELCVIRLRFDIIGNDGLPAWSLSALFGMLPTALIHDGYEYRMDFFKTDKGRYIIQYQTPGTVFPILCHQQSDEPIDAVAEMILWLSENKDLERKQTNAEKEKHTA